MLFIFDRSPVARLIKTIDSGNRTIEKLRQLVDIMVRDIDKMPYSYLSEANRRAVNVLPVVKDAVERDLLNSIYRMAFRRIQRIHIETRP